MKVAAIIQARLSSTRLAGKIMKQVLGKPLLEYQIERIKRAKLVDVICVATTTKESDQPIIDLCRRLSIPYVQGSEEDVLSRYYKAAKIVKADCIVRLTSDCPLIDPAVMDAVINKYISNYPQYHYVSNVIERTYPRGLDVEAFSMSVLTHLHKSLTKQNYREHVTLYVNKHPANYSIAHVKNKSGDYSHIRLTVDTIEDFQLIEKIITELYPLNKCFTFEDVLSLLSKHSDWLEINANVQQKEH
ncbi:glycosyltransferase family protein [Halobacillus salinarum]|uniref:Glycosyltransferase family protein n=1 Tax=Halobacillus salinarum TaxID=2932257 RepID=A0ABY4EFC9_9BACI|nr:glycosyltransferase family protein [Halobacillus salinarum]UOQ42871.1 glycosyltransferase family protein [Halobacillus salinarum]